VGEVSYKGHRYPAEIIAHCVCLYHRLPLSLREVEELMLVRGVIVTYETIRQWCAKFGPVYAAGLRRRQPRPGDKWHLDEVFLTINGRRQYPWRAVDQDGNVLDILVQCRRDAKAAKRFFRILLKRQCTSTRPSASIGVRRGSAALNQRAGERAGLSCSRNSVHRRRGVLIAL
jgi:transposase-like protein